MFCVSLFRDRVKNFRLALQLFLLISYRVFNYIASDVQNGLQRPHLNSCFFTQFDVLGLV